MRPNVVVKLVGAALLRSQGQASPGHSTGVVGTTGDITCTGHSDHSLQHCLQRHTTLGLHISRNIFSSTLFSGPSVCLVLYLKGRRMGGDDNSEAVSDGFLPPVATFEDRRAPA